MTDQAWTDTTGLIADSAGVVICPHGPCNPCLCCWEENTKTVTVDMSSAGQLSFCSYWNTVFVLDPASEDDRIAWGIDGTGECLWRGPIMPAYSQVNFPDVGTTRYYFVGLWFHIIRTNIKWTPEGPVSGSFCEARHRNIYSYIDVPNADPPPAAPDDIYPSDPHFAGEDIFSAYFDLEDWECVPEAFDLVYTKSTATSIPCSFSLHSDSFYYTFPVTIAD